MIVPPKLLLVAAVHSPELVIVADIVCELEGWLQSVVIMLKAIVIQQRQMQGL